jgi:hypothetical protein
MNRKTRTWTAGAVLALALCGTANLCLADDDEDAAKLKEAMAAAKKVVMANLNGITPAVADKLAKEHKIDATMKLMKPVSKNGISIGTLTKAGHKDSIELLIRDYAITPPTKAEVEKYNDDLIKSIQVVGVIAEMTPTWTPMKDGPMGKTREKWKALTEDMKKGSAELIAAAKAKDDKAVATAAKKLNESCAMCHKIFRDDK